MCSPYSPITRNTYPPAGYHVFWTICKNKKIKIDLFLKFESRFKQCHVHYYITNNYLCRQFISVNISNGRIRYSTISFLKINSIFILSIYIYTDGSAFQISTWWSLFIPNLSIKCILIIIIIYFPTTRLIHWYWMFLFYFRSPLYDKFSWFPAIPHSVTFSIPSRFFKLFSFIDSFILSHSLKHVVFFFTSERIH